MALKGDGISMGDVGKDAANKAMDNVLKVFVVDKEKAEEKKDVVIDSVAKVEDKKVDVVKLLMGLGLVLLKLDLKFLLGLLNKLLYEYIR